MKTWDDWSDFDVNLAIAKKLGFVVSHESNGHSAVDARGDDGYHAWFTIDYCNSWADMGPIIIENQITIAKELKRQEWQCFGGGYVIYYEMYIESEIGHECNHKNPLRAAAIVFLMMNGVNPE